VNWKFSNSKYNNSFITSPVIGWDGTIYFGVTDPYFVQILGLDGVTGSKKLQVELTDATELVGTSPALNSNGLLFFTASPSSIFSVDTSSGEIGWNIPTVFDGELELQQNGPNGTPSSILYINMVAVYTYSYSPNAIGAVNGDNGTVMWRFNVEEVAHLSGNQPLMAVGNNGLLYFGLNYLPIDRDDHFTYRNSLLVAFNPVNQEQIWTLEIATPPQIDLMAVGPDDTIYLMVSDLTGSYLQAVDGSAGKITWTISLPIESGALSLLNNGEQTLIIITSYFGDIQAYNTLGDLVWQNKIGEPSAAPIFVPGNAIVSVGKQSLFALDFSSGAVLSSFDIEDDFIRSLAADINGNIIVATSLSDSIISLSLTRSSWTSTTVSFLVE